jgi:ketosteroid isomerase-like protein
VDEPCGSSQAYVEIDEGKAAFADAIRHGDTGVAAAAYTKTARLLAPSADLIEGRDSIEAFWQAGLDAGVVDVDFKAVAVQRRDRVAYEVGRYVLQLRPAAGETVVDRGTYVLVLEQQADGSWRRAVEMFNPEAQPAPPDGTHRAL